MTDSLSGQFLAEDPKENWSSDPRLERLADYIDQIYDVRIKAFTKYVLSKCDAFWEAPVDKIADGSYPPDELKPGGLLRNTRRSVRAFIYINSTHLASLEETDCAISALLLRNCNRALWADDEHSDVIYDPFYLYTIDAFIEKCLAESKLNHEDTGSVSEISGDAIALITRLIHTSDGAYSLIPETFPTTPLEKAVHYSVLMGSLCYDILQGEKPRAK